MIAENQSLQKELHDAVTSANGNALLVRTMESKVKQLLQEKRDYEELLMRLRGNATGSSMQKAIGDIIFTQKDLHTLSREKSESQGAAFRLPVKPDLRQKIGMLEPEFIVADSTRERLESKLATFGEFKPDITSWRARTAVGTMNEPQQPGNRATVSFQRREESVPDILVRDTSFVADKEGYKTEVANKVYPCCANIV